jgi:hypothetical protein
MNKETKFKVGDKAHKPKGYKFPCTIVGVFETINGDIRVVGEMDEYGLLHIFNEDQLEHYNEEQPNYRFVKLNMGKEDKDFLWSLMPKWVKEVPSEDHSFDPTFFGTLSREGDLKVHNRVIKLLNQDNDEQPR